MEFYLTALLLGLGFAAMAMGIFISMQIFHIPDITTDGSFTLGSAVTAVMLTSGTSPLITLLLAFLAGSIAGAVTAFIHTRLKVHALLAGILVMTALYSVNLAIMGRSTIPLMETSSVFTLLHFGSQEELSRMIILLFITLLIFFLLTLLLKTDFGLAMRATGNNEKMVRALGIHSDRMKMIGLSLANGLTAVSGCLITQIQGFADINMGIGIVVLGLGSVMIGNMLLTVFRSQNIVLLLAGVIFGSIIFRLILAFTLSIGIDPLYLKLVVAGIVLLVVSLPNLRRAT